MLSILNQLAHSAQQYVIGINCSAATSISRLVHRLKMMDVKCMDVVAYSAVRDFKYYFDHVDAAERLPLLFIFSDDEVCLVHNYRDLQTAASRIAA